MSYNSFGNIFKITTCGESHGEAMAVIIDGCPAGLNIEKQDIQLELDRRRPGQNDITTPRFENDTVNILSGVFEGQTTGMPILLIVYNDNKNSKDYNRLKNLYRPSHADFTYCKKYGIRDYKGGGRSSARETLARVASGAIAQKYLKLNYNIKIFSYVERVGNVQSDVSFKYITREMIDVSVTRCPDISSSKKMIMLIKKIQSGGDSVGGIIRGVIKNVPIGLGEPVFCKISSSLSMAMLGINAVKGFDIGLGFNYPSSMGSNCNDELIIDKNKVNFKTNYSGGLLGGISNGEDIYFRIAFKPVSTIKKQQSTISTCNENVLFRTFGRHDACILPRAVPIVDAMSAIVIIDHILLANHY